MVAGSRTRFTRKNASSAGVEVGVRLFVRQIDRTVASTNTTKAKLFASKAPSAGSTETTGGVARHDAPARQLRTGTALRP
jgi:hypothetical protein